jgi:hypothetical protein
MKAHISWIIGIASLVALHGGVFYAHGADTSPSLAVCDFSAEAKSLAQAREEAESGEFEAIRSELETRKQMLKSIIACIVEDIESTRSDIQAMRMTDARDKRIAERLIERMDDMLRESTLQDAYINELGLRGTQDVARTLKDLRARIYAPARERVENFSLWLGVQKLIATADGRLHDIKTTLRALDIGENDAIRRDVNSAENNLVSAHEKYESVRLLFEQLANPIEISESIKMSLSALEASYQDFFRISDEVKKVVPL